MKLIIHRLLLAIIWVPTIGIEVLLYADTKRSDETSVQMIQDHYQGFLVIWLIGLVLSLIVNWILTGNMNNWAGKIWDNN